MIKEWSCIAAIVIIFILFQNSCASHRCVFGLIGLSCREHSHRTGDYFYQMLFCDIFPAAAVDKNINFITSGLP